MDDETAPDDVDFDDSPAAPSNATVPRSQLAKTGAAQGSQTQGDASLPPERRSGRDHSAQHLASLAIDARRVVVSTLEEYSKPAKAEAENGLGAGQRSPADMASTYSNIVAPAGRVAILTHQSIGQLLC